ncbi:MAG: hypothetical protein A3I61_20095 [Acidobacteria bacterium RIFCSPLOWO2_02_FULL_68_18]|nr:MAG: hypothetical protein A3I61_20095 [Acidobacteria bacterium RIFCSPLOWO2_02_FULL_68_18]OFW48237.1 MAG: hypothetical protein A3G77_03045 [Acidobacteria bacterium RIFCSPLOWO2_12_FULL_68_19]
MNEPREIIEAFIEAVCQLSKANRLTGIWDNRRFQACKEAFENVDCRYLYKAEKLSRFNVEQRAVYRAQIDILFEKLLDSVNRTTPR